MAYELTKQESERREYLRKLKTFTDLELSELDGLPDAKANEILMLLQFTGCTNNGELFGKSSYFGKYGFSHEAKQVQTANELKAENETLKAGETVKAGNVSETENKTILDGIQAKQTANAPNVIQAIAANKPKIAECESVLVDNFSPSNCNGKVTIKRNVNGEMLNFCGNCSFQYNKENKR